MNAPSIIDILLDMAIGILGGDIGSIMLMDLKENDVLKVVASKGLTRDLMDMVKVKIGTCISGKVITYGSAVLIRGQEENQKIGISKDDLKRGNINWSFILPIYHGSIPIGVLNIASLNPAVDFSCSINTISKTLLRLFNKYLFYSAGNIHMLGVGLTQYMHEIAVDPLTGLYTYGQLWARLEEEINRSKRFKYKIVIIMVDIDHFKNINIRYGYEVGDNFLLHFSEWMRKELRRYSVIARTGGARFTVMLPETDKSGGIKVANRLLSGVQNIGRELGIEEMITLSAGVSFFPEDADSATEMLQKAEEALISAKIMGGNLVKTIEREDEI